MGISFAKYHGLGNDFILIDNRQQSEPSLSPQAAVELCDRHFGVGADGVIFALNATDGCDYAMRIFNSDGSEPEMCGNGIRCLARFLDDIGAERPLGDRYRIHTLAGVMTPQLQADGWVKVDMGQPRLLAGEIPTTLVEANQKAIDVPIEVDGTSWSVTCVSMGNPHCITFVDRADEVPLAAIGPKFERHPAFPKRTNTEFVEILGSDSVKMRVWERGAGATLACGTGACAILVAGVLTGRCRRRTRVELPGGGLDIEWSESDGRLYMSGPAERAFEGRL